eukprot:690652_1
MDTSPQRSHNDFTRCSAMDVLDDNNASHVGQPTLSLTPNDFQDSMEMPKHNMIYLKKLEFETQNRSSNDDDYKANIVLEVNDIIVTDIYDCLRSWDDTLMDNTDKRDINNTEQMSSMFHKYIFNRCRIHDARQLSILESIKHTIVDDIFYFICDQNHTQTVSFISLMQFIHKLDKHQFKKIINKTDQTETNSVHKSFTNSMSPLESIDEHTPLDHDDGYNEDMDGYKEYSEYIHTAKDSPYKSESHESHDVIRTAEIRPREQKMDNKTYRRRRRKSNDESPFESSDRDEDKRKRKLSRLQKLKKKLKDIDALQRRLKKGAKLEINQLEKIEQRSKFEEEKKRLETWLSAKKNANDIEMGNAFISKLYQLQCTKQRDEYKQSASEMDQKCKEFLRAFEKLQKQNERLMEENEALKEQNTLLKKKLNDSEK